MATNLQSYVGTTYPGGVFYETPVSGTPLTRSSGAITIGGSNTGNFGQPLSSQSTVTITGAGRGTLTLGFSETGGPNYDGAWTVLGVSSTAILLEKVVDSVQTYGVIAATNSSYFVYPYPDLQVDSAYATDNSTFSPPAATEAAPCFASGTRLAVSGGWVAVEDVRVGALLTLAGGGEGRVVWTGRRRVSVARHPRPHLVRPVRIAADAFAPGVPCRDLLLSPDHAVHVDGVLIPAAALCNGATVRAVDVAEVTYHHVETQAHGVVLAENLPCETYLDMGNRRAFEGAAAMLHPDFAGVTAAAGCAPRLGDGAVVRAVRARLLARAQALGHVTETAPDLHLVVDGVRLDSPTLAFVLPKGAREVRIVSRAGAASDVSAATDRRRLGVCLDSVVVATARGRRDVLLHPSLVRGWHAAEGGALGWRWTDGDALLPASLLRGAVSVRLGIATSVTRWQDAA